MCDPQNPVKNNRSIVLFILLSFISCGLYQLYFIHSVAKDMNRICSGADRRKTAGLLLFLILTPLTCFLYPYYWFYKVGDRIASNARGQYGIYMNENGSTVLLWLILGQFFCAFLSFVGYNVVIKNLNTLASAYNDRLEGSDFDYPQSQQEDCDPSDLNAEMERRRRALTEEITDKVRE